MYLLLFLLTVPSVCSAPLSLKLQSERNCSNTVFINKPLLLSTILQSHYCPYNERFASLLENNVLFSEQVNTRKGTRTVCIGLSALVLYGERNQMLDDACSKYRSTDFEEYCKVYKEKSQKAKELLSELLNVPAEHLAALTVLADLQSTNCTDVCGELRGELCLTLLHLSQTFVSSSKGSKGEAEEINNENLSTANGKSFSQNVNRKLDLPSQNDVNTGLQNNIMNNQKEFSSYLNNQPNIVKHSKSRFNDDLNLKPTFFPRIKHNKKNFEDKSLNNYEKNQMFNQNDKMDEFPSIDLVQKERGHLLGQSKKNKFLHDQLHQGQDIVDQILEQPDKESQQQTFEVQVQTAKGYEQNQKQAHKGEQTYKGNQMQTAKVDGSKEQINGHSEMDDNDQTQTSNGMLSQTQKEMYNIQKYVDNNGQLQADRKHEHTEKHSQEQADRAYERIQQTNNKGNEGQTYEGNLMRQEAMDNGNDQTDKAQEHSKEQVDKEYQQTIGGQEHLEEQTTKEPEYSEEQVDKETNGEQQQVQYLGKEQMNEAQEHSQEQMNNIQHQMNNEGQKHSSEEQMDNSQSQINNGIYQGQKSEGINEEQEHSDKQLDKVYEHIDDKEQTYEGNLTHKGKQIGQEAMDHGQDLTNQGQKHTSDEQMEINNGQSPAYHKGEEQNEEQEHSEEQLDKVQTDDKEQTYEGTLTHKGSQETMNNNQDLTNQGQEHSSEEQMDNSQDQTNNGIYQGQKSEGINEEQEHSDKQLDKVYEHIDDKEQTYKGYLAHKAQENSEEQMDNNQEEIHNDQLDKEHEINHMEKEGWKKKDEQLKHTEIPITGKVAIDDEEYQGYGTWHFITFFLLIATLVVVGYFLSHRHKKLFQHNMFEKGQKRQYRPLSQQ